MSLPLTGLEPSPLPGPGSQFTKESILRDYRIAFRSRQVSLLGRREVFTGKAKFGIFGDGKEVAQVALARAFRARRLPLRLLPRPDADVRARAAHRRAVLRPALRRCRRRARALLGGARDDRPLRAPACWTPDGGFRDRPTAATPPSDVSPTGSQMPRLVGLAYASKLYRELPELHGDAPSFSRHGDEIAFGTIGNASCAEGMFWEAVNAVGVLQAPMLLSIWDDGYGISVPNELQITKGDLSALLSGFRRAPGEPPGVRPLHRQGVGLRRRSARPTSRRRRSCAREHVPALVHVVEMTQPQGHSTSGSHERYKSQGAPGVGDGVRPASARCASGSSSRGSPRAQELEAVEAEDLQARARGAAPRLGRRTARRSTPSGGRRWRSSTSSPARGRATPRGDPQAARRSSPGSRRRCAATSSPPSTAR